MKVLDNDQWVSQQFSECELGDARRTKRLLTVAGNMLSRPEASLVAQNVEWADVKAAYRFFDNSAVTFDAVSEQHCQQTRNTNP